MYRMIARSIHVRGVVQGVGFRPFVYRLAYANGLAGWALNQDGGVELHLEGAEASLQAFLKGLWSEAPPAAHSKPTTRPARASCCASARRCSGS